MAVITNNYEMMFVVDPVKASSNWQDMVTEIQSLFGKNEIEPLDIRKYAERKLAYPLKKNLMKYDRGCYILTYFKSEPGRIAKFKRDVALSDSILRCLILRLKGEPKIPEIPQNGKVKEES